jgi:acyl-CoA thioesterase I
MHPLRPLAVTATALLLGAIALSGCTTASSRASPSAPPSAARTHPTVAVIGDSIESGI